MYENSSKFLKIWRCLWVYEWMKILFLKSIRFVSSLCTSTWCQLWLRWGVLLFLKLKIVQILYTKPMAFTFLTGCFIKIDKIWIDKIWIDKIWIDKISKTQWRITLFWKWKCLLSSFWKVFNTFCSTWSNSGPQVLCPHHLLHLQNANSH